MSLQLRSRKIIRKDTHDQRDQRLIQSETNILNGAVKDDIQNEKPSEKPENYAPTKNKTLSQCSKSSSLTARRRQLVTENFIQKVRFEQEMLRKEQEIADYKFQMNLLEIDEEEQAEKASNYEDEFERPNIARWVNKKNPWDDQSETSENSWQKIEDLAASTPNKGMDDVLKRYSVPQKSEKPLFPLYKKINAVPESDILNKFITRQSIPQDLPIFEGNPLEWPNFIHQFQISTSVCGFTDEENQCRLQKALKGNARKVVQSLLITPRNLKSIIEILQTRYGNSEQIITVLVENLRKLPIIKAENLENFINFSDEVKNFITTIQALDEEEYLYNPLLLQELLNKLPLCYKISWTDHLGKMKDKKRLKLVEFSNWLNHKANIMVQVQNSTPSYNTKNKKELTLTTTTKDITYKTGDKRCLCCGQELHKLYLCDKFNSMTIEERWSFVTAKKICFSCLIPFHVLKDCRNIKRCTMEKCEKMHHTLLHKAPRENGHQQLPIEQTINTNCNINTDRNTLLKILPVNVIIGTKRIEIFALLDDASTLTLIDQKLADNLNLTGPEETLCLQWTNENITHTDKNSKIVSFWVSGRKSTKQYLLKHVRTTDLSLPTQSVNVEVLRQKYPYLNSELPSFNEARPSMIIGQDNWPLLLTHKMVRGSWNGPVASKTALGWVLHGNIQNKTQPYNIICRVSHTEEKKGEKDDLDLLHDLVKEQWKLECIKDPSKKEMSREDKRAQIILDSTMKRVGKRFETGLLWRNDNTRMPESKINALKRLQCVEKKMDKNVVYAKTYCEKIEDLINKGYLRKLSPEDASKITPKTWYLPHFGVVNPNKPNKLRIVFDASSRSNGSSLNDFLLTGPDLYNSLLTILLNFRIKRYAFTADIKEMFLQVKVRPDDICAQRILWRGMERLKQPETYEFTVVFFGSVSGPCLAQEAKNKNAKDYGKTFPKATEEIINKHYMDDYLGNADTIEEAKKLVKEIIFINKEGGFCICNWIANNNNILEELAKRKHRKN